VELRGYNRFTTIKNRVVLWYVNNIKYLKWRDLDPRVLSLKLLFRKAIWVVVKQDNDFGFRVLGMNVVYYKHHDSFLVYNDNDEWRPTHKRELYNTIDIDFHDSSRAAETKRNLRCK
jgi:hypothetical protein